MKLIEHWKAHIGSAWSIRLAGAFATVVGLLVANPTLVIGLIAFIPTGAARYIIAAVIWVVVFGVPTVTSLIAQPKLKAKVDAAKD